ncbi:hypothetical protein ABWK46_06280 [Peribacillus frigoritolerans]|uniref:hypothetical protein n=1 Tax=Peribacillus frigoritolerans TaxID=450367 RepID=UPI0033951C32
MQLNVTRPAKRLRKPGGIQDDSALFMRNGAVIVKKEISEIIKELGFDQTQPITFSANDQKAVDADSDYFKDWYEEELRELYESES